MDKLTYGNALDNIFIKEDVHEYSLSIRSPEGNCNAMETTEDEFFPESSALTASR